MGGILGQVLTGTTLAIESAGVLVISLGILVAGYNFFRRSPPDGRYRQLRATLGRAILLGLELLVAADIIRTVAIEPTLDSLMVLGGIVLIRTFLSLSLEVEIEGRWPWRRAEGNASSGDRTAA